MTFAAMLLVWAFVLGLVFAAVVVGLSEVAP